MRFIFIFVAVIVTTLYTSATARFTTDNNIAKRTNEVEAVSNAPSAGRSRFLREVGSNAEERLTLGVKVPVLSELATMTIKGTKALVGKAAPKVKQFTTKRKDELVALYKFLKLKASNLKKPRVTKETDAVVVPKTAG